jgi:hypothetical protein
MISTILILNLLTLISPTDNSDPVGTYSSSRKGKYSSTSWATRTLEFNCDATVSLSYRTHGGLFQWQGSWTNNNDTLIVKVKPMITEDGKEYYGPWNKDNWFLIKRNRLTPIDPTKNVRSESYKKIDEKDCS